VVFAVNRAKKFKIFCRLLTPQLVVSIYYFIKYGAKISLKSEVDLTSTLTFGRDCVISSFTKIKASGGHMRIGNRGGFAAGCVVSAYEAGIEIGDNFICGPNVNIIGGNYNYAEKDLHLEDQGSTSKGITIGDNVWVGAGTTILDGSRIGDNAIIVANSLINRRYPSDVILQGNPAKIILRR
jgi:acetyltransferase-like isoleucine patch superfamily enzyme